MQIVPSEQRDKHVTSFKQLFSFRFLKEEMANDLPPGCFIEELNTYSQKHNTEVKYYELSKAGPAHDLT